MALIDHTENDNYTELHATDQGLVDAAVTAIRAAFAGARVRNVRHKANVRVILEEIVRLEDET